jgi:hypothetical protein
MTEDDERTVEQLLDERIDGDVESVAWHGVNGSAKYGLVGHITGDDRAQLTTVVLDVDDDTLRVHRDNSLWLPADPQVLDVATRSLARLTSVAAGSLDEDREPLAESLLPFDADEVGAYELVDDYDPSEQDDDEPWQASEGPDEMDVVHQRLVDSPIDNADRMIRLERGGKAPWSGEPQRIMRHPDEVGGNYGVEVAEDDDLVVLDVDDMEAAPLDRLPDDGLTSESPHGGRHYLLHAPGWLDTFRERFDVLNPHTEWGEVRSQDGYVVGPGCRITRCKYGCDVDDCEATKCGHGCCTEDDPGVYLLDDGQIATIDAETLADLLAEGRGVEA